MTLSSKTRLLLGYIFVLCIFVVSRLVTHFAGMPWDGTFINWGWQAIDVDLMRDRLAESLWYSHHQPPAFNLWIGCMVKISPQHFQYWLQGSFLLGGLLMHLSIWHVMRRLGIRPWIRVAVSLLFMLSPSAIAYESWLFYEHPAMMMMSLAAVFLVEWLYKPRWGWIFGFFLTLALLVLTRTLFQWFWLIAIIALILIAMRKNWKTILTASLLPLLLVFGWMTKNQVLFGFFGTSSWTGMNIGKIVLRDFWQHPEFGSVVDSGKVPPICGVYPFAKLYIYRNFDLQRNPYPNIRVLSDSVANETYNYNQFEYIDISRQFGKGAMFWVKRHPEIYFQNVQHASGYFFQPSISYPWLALHNEKMQQYSSWYTRWVLGCPNDPITIREHTWKEWPLKKTQPWSVYVAYVIVGLWGLAGAGRAIFRWRTMNWQKYLPLAFMLFVVAYITLVSITTEIGENMRFRMLTIPYGWILVGMVVETLIAVAKRLFARRSARSTGQPVS